MSLKLKALGLGLLAMLAIGAMTVMNASANTSGHFTWGGSDHLIIVGEETANAEEKHTTELTVEGEGLVCNEVSYSGTTESSTTTDSSVTITPTYKKCETTDKTAVTVNMNGCDYEFSVGENATPTTNTMYINCPVNKAIDLEHPLCTTTIPTQTIKGIGYHTILTEGKHAITVSVDAVVKTEYHGGLCVFLGTNHTFTVEGSVIATGFNTAGEKVDITATGSVS